jgi:hypothetical protein
MMTASGKANRTETWQYVCLLSTGVLGPFRSRFESQQQQHASMGHLPCFPFLRISLVMAAAAKALRRWWQDTWCGVSVAEEPLL